MGPKSQPKNQTLAPRVILEFLFQKHVTHDLENSNVKFHKKQSRNHPSKSQNT